MTTKPAQQVSEDSLFIPGTLDAAIPGDLLTEQPIRVSFEPYYGSTCGDPEPSKPGYRRLDGYLKGSSKYATFRTVSSDWFIIADGEEFAPSWEEYIDKEIIDAMGDVEELENVISRPLADAGLVLGKRAHDGDGYVPVGINPVLLIPRDTEIKTTKTKGARVRVGDVELAEDISSEVKNAVNAVKHIDRMSQKNAKEKLKNAKRAISRAQRQLEHTTVKDE